MAQIVCNSLDRGRSKGGREEDDLDFWGECKELCFFVFLILSSGDKEVLVCVFSENDGLHWRKYVKMISLFLHKLD